MTNKSKHEFTFDEKAAILNSHFLEGLPVSVVCKKYEITKEEFNSWHKVLLDNAPATLKFADSELSTKHKRNTWHRIFGSILQKLLTPLGITVFTDLQVMTNPPKADIILLTKPGESFTEEQKQYLPDGIRDSKAEHIIIEFKYTESITKESFAQAYGYDFFYKRSQTLEDNKVQTFLVS